MNKVYRKIRIEAEYFTSTPSYADEAVEKEAAAHEAELRNTYDNVVVIEDDISPKPHDYGRWWIMKRVYGVSNNEKVTL